MRTRGKAAAKWRVIIQAHQTSGLSVARFCRDHGVPASSFFAWRRRLSHEHTVRSGSAFIEINARPAVASHTTPASTPIQLLLPAGHRLLLRCGFDRQLLLDLLQILEGRP